MAPTPIAVVPWLAGSEIGAVLSALSGCPDLVGLWTEPGDPRPLSWLINHIAALGSENQDEPGWNALSVLQLARPTGPESLRVAGFPGSIEEFGTEPSPLWRDVFDELWSDFANRLPKDTRYYAEIAPAWLAGILRAAGHDARELVVIEDPRSVAARLWSSRASRGYGSPWMDDPSLPWALVDQLRPMPSRLGQMLDTGCDKARLWVRVEDQQLGSLSPAVMSWLETGEAPATRTTVAPTVEGLPHGVVEAITDLFRAELERCGYAV